MASNAFSVYTSFKAKDGMSAVFQSMKNKASVFGGQLNKLKSQTQVVGTKIKGLKNSFDGVKTAIGGVVTAIAAGVVANTLQSWVDKASDLQETLGKTNETFKGDAGGVIEWSKNSIKLMGLAQQTALDTAALYGDMGAGMGMNTKRAAEMAKSLTQLSADIASFKNVDQAITSNALKSIYTGETETLKNLGVVMTQENLQEFAKKIGMNKKVKDMSQSEKIELRYQYVMESTKNSQGDFLRTGGNFANQQRMFEENKKEMETRLGSILLPKYNAVMKSLNGMFAKYSPGIEKGFGKLFKNFEEGLKICSPLFEKFQGLFKTFNSTIMPIILQNLPMIKTLLSSVVVPALGVVIDTIGFAFKAIKTVYDIGSGLFDFIKSNWLPLLLILPAAIIGVRFAIDMLRLKMALCRMEGGLLSILINTKLITSLIAFKAKTLETLTSIAAKAAAFMLTPWGIAILGITAIVGAVILLWKNWDKVTAVVGTWWNNTKTFLGELWVKCKEVFSAVGNFIKEHFVDILLFALGPVGQIIAALKNIPNLLKDIKNHGKTIKIEGEDGNEIQTKTPKINNNGKNGQIEVKTTIDNRTGYKATTSTSLQSPNNLRLKPV